MGEAGDGGARGIVVVLTVLAGLLVRLGGRGRAVGDVRRPGPGVRGDAHRGPVRRCRPGPGTGAWQATVRHDELRQGEAVPITGGSFTLYGARRVLGGTFTDGSVTPDVTPATCENERFNVAGTLALQGGGRGAFAVVLTHLRVLAARGARRTGRRSWAR